MNTQEATNNERNPTELLTLSLSLSHSHSLTHSPSAMVSVMTTWKRPTVISRPTSESCIAGAEPALELPNIRFILADADDDEEAMVCAASKVLCVCALSLAACSGCWCCDCLFSLVLRVHAATATAAAVAAATSRQQASSASELSHCGNVKRPQTCPASLQRSAAQIALPHATKLPVCVRGTGDGAAASNKQHADRRHSSKRKRGSLHTAARQFNRSATPPLLSCCKASSAATPRTHGSGQSEKPARHNELPRQRHKL